MRKFLLCLLFTSLFMIPLNGSGNNKNSIYLTGGNLLDVTQGKTIPNALVIIEEDTIVYAGPEKKFEKSPDITVIDCSGKTILPGLFDAHIHLGGAATLGYIFIEDTKKLNAFLYSGVTSVFDLGAVQDLIFSLREEEKKNKLVSPRIFAVGPVFTSPKGHGTEYGVPMSITPTTEIEAREAVRKLIKDKPDHIKIIYEKGAERFTSLSYELMEVIIDEAHKNNFPVVTHIIITFEHARDALKAGTDGLAHMVTDQEVSEEFLDEMELMVEAGIPPSEVIKAATANAAEILGKGDKLGTISRGKLADILVVEGDPLENIQNTQNICMVIKNGQVLDREELAQKINPSEKPSVKSENKAKTSKKAESTPAPEIDSAVRKQIIAAKELLKKGVDTWDPDLMKKSRDRLLGLMAREKKKNLYILYYIALCDYRLATYYLTLAEMDKAEPYIKEGQDYLKKAMELDPDFGELDAFYAYMLGFEIALNPEKGMSLGFQIYQYFGKAFEKSPENSRVHYLKGVSDLYTPAEYGGGADAAIKTLAKSVDLFEKENIEDPVLPSWGKEEAYTFLAMAYNQKGDKDKAVEFFQKALEVNPEFMMAKDELEKIKK